MPPSIERGSELVSSGTRTGVSPDAVGEAVRFVRAHRPRGTAAGPADYQVKDTARRVVAFVLGTAHAHHANAGIRRRP